MNSLNDRWLPHQHMLATACLTQVALVTMWDKRISHRTTFNAVAADKTVPALDICPDMATLLVIIHQNAKMARINCIAMSEQCRTCESTGHRPDTAHPDTACE